MSELYIENVINENFVEDNAKIEYFENSNSNLQYKSAWSEILHTQDNNQDR